MRCFLSLTAPLDIETPQFMARGRLQTGNLDQISVSITPASPARPWSTNARPRMYWKLALAIRHSQASRR